MGMSGLLIRYFCYDFLILMFTYGSIYCIKGATTMSLTGAADNAFDYTIYNVNTRAEQLVHAYKKQNQLLQSNVAPAIYAQIIKQNVTQKISALETYLNT